MEGGRRVVREGISVVWNVLEGRIRKLEDIGRENKGSLRTLEGRIRNA